MPPDGRSVDDFALADPTITRGHYSSPKDPKGSQENLKTFFDQLNMDPGWFLNYDVNRTMGPGFFFFA